MGTGIRRQRVMTGPDDRIRVVPDDVRFADGAQAGWGSGGVVMRIARGRSASINGCKALRNSIISAYRAWIGAAV